MPDTSQNAAIGLSNHHAAISRLCSENEDATSLIFSAWKACEVWDDLVDNDKVVPAEEVNKLLIWALFGLSENRTYKNHPELTTALRVTVSNWLASNHLQKDADREKRVTSYTLRCSPYDFFVAVVLAASGPDKADEAALYFRSLNSPDTLEGYLSEHAKD